MCHVCIITILHLKVSGLDLGESYQSLGQMTRKNYAKTFDKELQAWLVVER